MLPGQHPVKHQWLVQGAHRVRTGFTSLQACPKVRRVGTCACSKAHRQYVSESSWVSTIFVRSSSLYRRSSSRVWTQTVLYSVECCLAGEGEGNIVFGCWVFDIPQLRRACFYPRSSTFFFFSSQNEGSRHACVAMECAQAPSGWWLAK